MSFENVLNRATVLAGEIEDTDAREELIGCLRKLAGFYNYLEAEGRPEPHPLDMEPPADSLEALAHRWRAEADTLRSSGADAIAKVVEGHADQLEATAHNRAHDTLTLEEAAEIGGYGYDHLQKLVADGTIPNAGQKGSPRIFRKDVPRKPGQGSGPKRRSRTEIVKDVLGHD